MSEYEPIGDLTPSAGKRTAVCKSTRYGDGCGHPTPAHDGTGSCCCCNGNHNDPEHAKTCLDCATLVRTGKRRLDP